MSEEVNEGNNSQNEEQEQDGASLSMTARRALPLLAVLLLLGLLFYRGLGPEAAPDEDRIEALTIPNLGEFDEFRTAHLFRWRGETQPD